MPFSCVFYPLNTLPAFLHPLALALPTTHSFEGMRQVLAGEGILDVGLPMGCHAGYRLCSTGDFVVPEDVRVGSIAGVADQDGVAKTPHWLIISDVTASTVPHEWQGGDVQIHPFR